jgi:hypothetical protein
MERISPESSLHLQKEEEWNRVALEVESIVDRLGKTIDTGIKETVIALKALGLETQGSCEGHLDHGTKAPWVDIGSVPEDSARRALTNAERSETVPQRSTIEAREKIFAERTQILRLLDEYYGTHNPTSTSRLIPLFRLGETRIISQGYGIQEGLDEKEQAMMLSAYREEINRFTVWMRDEYFHQ